MAVNEPKKKRSWFRRLVNLTLLVTAGAMWMNLYHVNPWAYVTTPKKSAVEEPSNLERRVTGRIEAANLQQLINKIENEHSVRIEFDSKLEKQLMKSGATVELALEAEHATVRSLLITAITTFGAYRFESRGNVLEVSEMASTLSPKTQVHPIVGGWAPDLVKGPASSGADAVFAQQQFKGLVGYSQLNWAQAGVLRLRGQYFTGLPHGFFAGPRWPVMHGGVAIYSETTRNHELFRELDEELAGESYRTPSYIRRLGESFDERFNARLLERIDFEFPSGDVSEALAKLLKGKVSYIFNLRDEKALRWQLSLSLKDVRRIDALRLLMKQSHLKATMVDNTVAIASVRYERGAQHRAYAFVGDLIEPQRALPPMLNPGGWTARMNRQLMVMGGWQDLHAMEEMIQAGRDAQRTTEPGDIVFVGDEATRKIQRLLLEPAKPLGQIATASELAAALRKTYGLNVVLHPVHADKRLGEPASDLQGLPLFRLLGVLLPKSAGGHFSVEHGALIIDFGGPDKSQPPNFWIRTGPVFDSNFDSVVTKLFGVVTAVPWPDSLLHHRASEIALVRADRDDLVKLRRAIQMIQGAPSEPTKLEGSLFAQKFRSPQGFSPLEEITLPEVLTPPSKYRHPFFALCLGKDGVFAMGNREELAKIEETLQRWAAIQIEDPIDEFENADWLVRHKAALTAISQLRADPNEEQMKRYAEPFLLSKLLSSKQRQLFVELVSKLGANSPSMAPLYAKPFIQSADTDFRIRIIDLLFEIGVPAQGQLHELANEMNDNELSYVSDKLAGINSAVARKDWWPLVIRVYDKYPQSHSRLRSILEGYGEPPRTPGTLPTFPSINSTRTPR